MPEITRAPTRQQLLALLALLQQDQTAWQLGNILGVKRPAPTVTGLRRVLGDGSISSPTCVLANGRMRSRYHLVTRAAAEAWAALARPQDQAKAQGRLDAVYEADASAATLSDVGIRQALQRALQR